MIKIINLQTCNFQSISKVFFDDNLIFLNYASYLLINKANKIEAYMDMHHSLGSHHCLYTFYVIGLERSYIVLWLTGGPVKIARHKLNHLTGLGNLSFSYSLLLYPYIKFLTHRTLDPINHYTFIGASLNLHTTLKIHPIYNCISNSISGY